MNAKRTRRVGELGAGIHARKIVSLSLRHPNHLFEGVDLYPKSGYARTLREKKQHTKPANLDLRPGTDALEFLRKKPKNHYSHMYAHFVLQKFPYRKRHELIHEIARTMEPGSRLKLVEEYHFAEEFRKELLQAGFQVHVKSITPQELLKLDTYNATENATDQLKMRAIYDSLPEQLPADIAKKTGVKTKAQLQELHRRQMVEIVGKDLFSREPGAFDTEANASLQRIARVAHYRWDMEKPFVVITCKKPRE